MTELVGRAAERRALRGHAAAGPPVVLVSGEAGVGKTSLVEDVLGGGPVLRGRAGEWQAAAYDVLAQVLRQAGATAPGLAAVLPELGPPPGPANRSLLAAGIRAALGPDPRTVLLDDLQWADEDTLDLLPALADALRGGPVRVVGCYRDDELPRRHRLRVARAELRRRRLLAEVALGPLPDADARTLVGRLLGPDADPAVAEAVLRRADGIPFAVEELAAATAGPAVPDGIREAVQLRTGRLPAPARAVLEAAAVAGTEFDVAEVLALAGVAEWPDGPAGAGLVAEPAGGRSRFRHALTRDAVYADVPESRRHRLHRALADRLTEPAAVAAHLLAAREPERARPALLAAAEAYRAVHAYRDAARALRQALDVWPTGAADRLDVVDRLARCAELTAEHAESVALLTELVDGYADPLRLAGAYRRLALAHELLGHWDPALAAREAAAGAYGRAGRPAEAAVERIAAASHLRSAASFRAALDLLTLARSDAEAAGRTDLVLRAEGHRGNVLARSGRGAEGVRTVRDALDRALAADLSGPAAEIYQRLADALEHTGDYPAATAAYRSAYEFCSVHGEDGAGQLCRACVTVVLFTTGQWDRGLAVCQEVLEHDDPIAHPRAVATCITGLIHAMRGRPDRARPVLLEARSLGTRIELVPAELLSRWGLAVLDDQAGDGAAAAEQLDRVLERWAGTEESHYSVPVLQWATTFFAERGAADRARDCAAALSVIAERGAQPEARAALAHALGETARLEGSLPVAVAELGRAAGEFERLALPVSAVLAQRRAAAALAAGGDRSAAVGLLRTAGATARRLSADYLSDQVAVGLTGLGEPAGRRRTVSAHGLSPRELEVMRLVATGCTSRQIATELFLSPRTVEMHVANSLQKLGCRTRAEAVRHMAERGLTRP